MQATAAGDLTAFCNNCADVLRSYYNDCTDGVGVSTVDQGKLK